MAQRRHNTSCSESEVMPHLLPHEEAPDSVVHFCRVADAIDADADADIDIDTPRPVGTAELSPNWQTRDLG
ncbi:hypothetical protein R1T08_03930 [Streptomyces sp. SBC-4]|nr:hypothetical protein [Streptomyces sp. SBC-4]MDV5143461.1 hypothetical protein [Streptomyces sp. SBC-4]